MAEWKQMTLGEVSEMITVGHVGSMASRYVDSGVPFLRSQNVRPGRIDLDDVKYIPQDFHQTLRKSQLRPNDVVIVRTGQPGAAALIPDHIGELNCADLVIVRPSESVDARFLCYSINATSGNYVLAHVVGAVQQHFNVGSARNLRILMPSLARQRSIADVLQALDDKIAVNERLVQGCDDLRHLQFEEVLRAHRESVAEVPLSTTADFINGRAFTKDATGSGRMVVRIAELNSGPGSSTVYNDIDVLPQYLAHAGDVLFAWSGSLTLARWYRDEAVINQHIFKVVPRDGLPNWLAFELVAQKLYEFRAVAASKATTMGHIQRHHLDELVQVPRRAIIGDLDARLRPLWNRALAAEMESLRLVQLRDALLPGLMSGQMRVCEAEALVADAT